MPPIETIAFSLGATRADIPGLWNLAGYPELTTGQLIQIWRETPNDA